MLLVPAFRSGGFPE